MTEPATFRRFTDLIEEGFELQEISSTTDHVVLEMENGHRRTVIELGPEAVQPFLDGAASKNARRLPAGTR